MGNCNTRILWCGMVVKKTLFAFIPWNMCTYNARILWREAPARKCYWHLSSRIFAITMLISLGAKRRQSKLFGVRGCPKLTNFVSRGAIKYTNTENKSRLSVWVVNKKIKTLVFTWLYIYKHMYGETTNTIMKAFDQYNFDGRCCSLFSWVYQTPISIQSYLQVILRTFL